MPRRRRRTFGEALTQRRNQPIAAKRVARGRCTVTGSDGAVPDASRAKSVVDMLATPHLRATLCPINLKVQKQITRRPPARRCVPLRDAASSGSAHAGCRHRPAHRRSGRDAKPSCQRRRHIACRRRGRRMLAEQGMRVHRSGATLLLPRCTNARNRTILYAAVVPHSNPVSCARAPDRESRRAPDPARRISRRW